MDSLLEALQSGAAFRDRRKRTPRTKDTEQQSLSPSSQRPVLKACNHENQKAALERSRSRHNVNFNASRAPVAKELNYIAESHSSTTRAKVAGKKAGSHPESSHEQANEPAGSASKSEPVPEVEALLARLRAM